MRGARLAVRWAVRGRERRAHGGARAATQREEAGVPAARPRAAGSRHGHLPRPALPIRPLNQGSLGFITVTIFSTRVSAA